MSSPRSTSGPAGRAAGAICRRTAASLALGLLALASLSSCVSQREALGGVRSRFGFDPSVYGKSGGAAARDDSAAIRSRYADSGWVRDEKGNMTARDTDLYRGKSFGRGREVARPDARLPRGEVESKYFRTPEYLERQMHRDQGATAREGRLAAREDSRGNALARESGLAARTESKPGFFKNLNPFQTGAARESAAAGFAAGEDREGTRAREAAPAATGTRLSDGAYFRDSVNTLDGVKKLLHPEAFN